MSDRHTFDGVDLDAGGIRVKLLGVDAVIGTATTRVDRPRRHGLSRLVYGLAAWAPRLRRLLG